MPPALTPPLLKLAELLASMPDVGLDGDFYCLAEPSTAPNVLVDTNVISEACKGRRADTRVIDFWAEVARNDTPFSLSSDSVGELRSGVDLIRHRGDPQYR